MNANVLITALNKNETPIGETGYKHEKRTDYFFQDNEEVYAVEIICSSVLTWINKHFSGVPCPRNVGGVRYYGDMAKFIWNNLPEEAF